MSDKYFVGTWKDILENGGKSWREIGDKGEIIYTLYQYPFNFENEQLEEWCKKFCYFDSEKDFLYYEIGSYSNVLIIVTASKTAFKTEQDFIDYVETLDGCNYCGCLNCDGDC